MSSAGNPAKWYALNRYNMQKARNLTRDVLKQVQDNEAAERASKDAAMEQVAREKAALRAAVFAKAAAHGEVISCSSKNMSEIEDGILTCANSLALLKQERALAFSAMQVCRRRLQLRDRRPKSELIKDAVADACEAEVVLLEAAREEFLKLEDLGKSISEELSRARAFLSQDTGARRLVMKQDKMTLVPHLAPPPEMQRPAPEIKEAESKSLLEDTFRLLDRTARHRQKSMDTVARIKEEARQANIKTEECLEKRADELQAVSKKLKEHMTEADAAISTAERSLERSDKRLDPNDDAKREKLMRDKALLEQLRSHKATLHTEIQNKFIALEIDNMCRRVTPVKACEPKLLDTQAVMPPISRHLSSSASAPSLGSSGGQKLPALVSPTVSVDYKAGAERFGTTSPKLKSSSSQGTLMTTPMH